jgi:spore germination protein YaaH
MAYDQGTVDLKLNAAAGGTPYVPVADPVWVKKIMLNAAKTISKNKLMIGIPTYGYEYIAKPLSQSGYRYTLQWAFNQKYALDLAQQISLTPVRNSAGEMSLAYNPSGITAAIPPPISELDPLAALPNTASTSADSSTGALSGLPFNILWWSDAQAVADKVALAHQLGLRGVAIFKFDGGEDQGMWGVLK